MVRVVIAVMWLPVMIWTVTARLLSEIRSAVWFAWMDCREEHAAMRRAWRSNRFDPEDWS